MTIKEMEERSGMTRANIRFYEAEGLLSPARAENDYREYSDLDLETLKRIKLLRTLHIPLEEIKAVQSGERELAVVLDSQIRALETEQADALRSQDICRKMREDNVRYDTLNAQKYLDDVAAGPAPVAELQTDTVPRLWAPWRRYLARTFDLSLYALLLDAFFTLILRIPFAQVKTQVRASNIDIAMDLTGIAVSLVLMLFLEPLFLHCCKTTPGKWLIGIRVTDENGGRLSYKAGLARTWGVLWKGMALEIPVASQIFLVKSYKDYKAGFPLSWEYDSELTVKPFHPWRGAALALAYALIVFGSVGISLAGDIPRHRGDITVAEFCDNFNTYQKQIDADRLYELSPEGRWVEAPHEPGAFFIEMDDPILPELTFTEENGVMTGVSLEYSKENGEWLQVPWRDKQALFVKSFVKAQKEAGLFGRDADPILKWIETQPNTETTVMSACGVQVESQYELSGYGVVGDGYLIPSEENRVLRFCFSMKKVN